MGLFAVSAVAGYLVSKITSKPNAQIPLRTRLRVRLPGGFARAALVSTGPSEWEIGPILQRQGSLPPRAGDLIVVEAPKGREVCLFRSRVVSLNGSTLVIEAPGKVFSKDRRKDVRREDVADWHAALDGSEVKLVNLTRRGAKVCGASGTQSQRVELRIGALTVPGWLMDVSSDGEARVMFEQELPSSVLKHDGAPLV